MRSHKAIQQGRVHTLYDPDLLSQVGEWLFEPTELERRGLLRRRTTGRRAAFVFDLEGRGFVLRHFWRGGLVGRWVDDRYLWTGLTRSRPLREWQLLETLSMRGQPVPQPAALRIERTGATYRADLITVELAATSTLADRLQEGPQEPQLWRRIGATIRRLHDCGAYHADLNARNILIDGSQRVFVIDWDRGALRRPGKWRQQNLDRLFRSLAKFERSLPRTHRTAADHEALLAGYQTPAEEPTP